MSMAEILSQQEIDALLTAFDGGLSRDSVGGEDALSPRIVKPYDFRRPDKFSKNQVRTINMIMESFGRSLGTALSAKLRSLVSFQVVSIDQLTYGEFLMSISDPSVIGIFSMDPLEGHAVFEMTTPTAFYVLEKLLGSKGPGAMVIRTLTEIEEVLITGILSDALRVLKQAMSNVVSISPKLETLENNPQFVQVVPPQDMVLLTSIEMKVGDNAGMIGICLPYVVIEPILASLSEEFFLTQGLAEGEEIIGKYMYDTLNRVEVDLIAELGRDDLAIEQLLSLEAGDVIILPQRTTAEAALYVDGIDKPKFKGNMGRIEKHRAVQITSVIPQEYEEEKLIELSTGAVK